MPVFSGKIAKMPRGPKGEKRPADVNARAAKLTHYPTPEEVDLWLAADAPKALELQRPLPDDALMIVASGEREDRAPEAA